MQFFVGLMSGTSLDGVDAALVGFEPHRCQIAQTFYLPFPDSLKKSLLELHTPLPNELEQGQLVANHLAKLYAEAVHRLLESTDIKPIAIGCHGQTIRHRPELGFTLQLNNPALLAELTGMTVVADFRSRDVAAGGQGAPLVPAFHHAIFSHSDIPRAIVNIGGISNLTYLFKDTISGFDCGPGNLLMDAWCHQHTGEAYDKNGSWARRGKVIKQLLETFLAHPFLEQSPPKSTGRDTFNLAWLEQRLQPRFSTEDVQATLVEFSAHCISDAILKHCADTAEVYLCGGGAHNQLLTDRLQHLLPHIHIDKTDALGISVDWVEAAAFAWLAKQCMEGKPGNLPLVTGATGPRILGAIYQT